MSGWRNSPTAPFPFPVREGLPLPRWTTFSIGGPARYATSVHRSEELQKVLSFCLEEKLRFYLLGRGSNCLFDDLGFDGLVIRNEINSLRFLSSFEVEAGAGLSLISLARLSASRGLSGLEFGAGIPGSVGGAIWMNGGASGQETFDTLVEVEAIRSDGTLWRWSREELSWGYRSSSFQRDLRYRGRPEQGALIVQGRFRLQPDEKAPIRLEETVAKRRLSHPYSYPSAGCIFQNPVGSCRSAGGWIDFLGYKGKRIGGAEVSVQHANFIVNRGGATSGHVRQLIAEIQEQVLREIGICLSPEVRWIPFDLDPEELL